MLPVVAIYLNYKVKVFIYTIEASYIDSNHKYHFKIDKELSENYNNSYSSISIIFIDDKSNKKNYFFKSLFKYSNKNKNLNKIKYDDYVDYILNNEICLRFNNSNWLEVII